MASLHLPASGFITILTYFPMRFPPAGGGAHVCFCLVFLFLSSTTLFHHAHAQIGKTVVVVGAGVCADCAQTNVDSGRAYSGLHVAVHCQLQNGKVVTRGAGRLDRAGRFMVVLPAAVIRDGALSEACFAQLHSASSSPCPSLAGPEFSKLMVRTRTESGHVLGLAGGDLPFSRETCASAFFWPFFKFHFWHHHFPAPIYQYPPPPPMYSYPSPPPPPSYHTMPPPPPPQRRKPPPPPPFRRKSPPPPPFKRKSPPPPFHKPHNPSPPPPIRKRPPPPPKSPIKKSPPPPSPIYRHPPPPAYHPSPPAYRPPYSHPPPAYFPPYSYSPPSPSYECIQWYKHPLFPFWKPCHPHPWFWGHPTFGNRLPFFPPMGSHP